MGERLLRAMTPVAMLLYVLQLRSFPTFGRERGVENWVWAVGGAIVIILAALFAYYFLVIAGATTTTTPYH